MALISIRISHALVWTSWLLFLWSFFLPATNALNYPGTPPGTPLTGWQAFTSSACAVLNPIMWIVEPRVLLLLSFPSANLLMIIAPLMFRILREKSAIFAILLLPCAGVPWLMPKTLMGDFFVGFYIWNWSFVAMSLGCILASIAYSADDWDQIICRAGASVHKDSV